MGDELWVKSFQQNGQFINNFIRKSKFERYMYVTKTYYI